MVAEIQSIGATLVPEDRRLGCLPTHFGREMIRVEHTIYAMCERLCSSYRGGLWKYFELSNGGFYMAPDIEGRLQVAWDGNFYEGEMSADALGIVATLMALSHLSFSTSVDSIAEHFHLLRDYALTHPEQSAIFAAID